MTDDSTTAPPAQRLRIESAGTIWGAPGTKIYLGDTDITASVYAVTWHIGANDNHGDATATVTFMGAQITAEAGDVQQIHAEPAKDETVEAVSLADLAAFRQAQPGAHA